MVDAGREDNQIILAELDTDPFVLLITYIEVTLPITDIPDFLVFVQVFSEEHLHLRLVHIAHSLRGDTDFIPVLVSTLFGQGIDRFDVGAVAVENTDRGEVVFGDRTTGVVGLALVSLL
jgi:hypothetical protein